MIDRNDRAIRVATKWYNEHLKSSKIKTVLLTDDVENRDLAKKGGVLAMSSKVHFSLSYVFRRTMIFISICTNAFSSGRLYYIVGKFRLFA